MSFTTDYTVRDCVRVAQKIRVQLMSIAVDSAGGDAGGDLELYGTITASGTTSATLFSKGSGNKITIHEGQQYGGGTPIAEAIIEVKPSPGQAINLHAKLTDYDPLFGDDSIGDETVANPYETGWRRDSTVMLTGSNARVRVNFTLAPI